MATQERKEELRSESPQPIETNYSAHETNPGPSKEAVEEKNEDGAGKAMKWVLPIIVLVLLIVWFIFFRNNVTK
ncbi:MAG: hypothetical protein EOO89_28305 [Pedobacter sp.]|nr:MAG: hypothetical protein EOO89_28305 [Pedobacter sp.]